jgi:NAD-specific glutamate dehydrogenase
VLAGDVRDYLSPGELQRLEARIEGFRAGGLPEDLALSIASLPLADRGLNILRICESTGVQPLEAAAVYARLGDETGINWVYGRLSLVHRTTLWDRMVLVDLRRDLLALQRDIAEDVFALKPDDLGAALDEFLEAHAADLARVRELQQRASADASPSALMVITTRLRSLRPGS